MDLASVTTEEILERTGIQSRKTLTRWRQRGLIPKPRIGTHPSGNGRAAYWPAETVERCIFIKSLIANGRSLDETGQLLEIIEVTVNHPKQEYLSVKKLTAEGVTAAVQSSSAVTDFTMIVNDKVAEFSRAVGGFNHELLWRLSCEIARPETTKQIVKLARGGFHVVLVLQGGLVKVMPDFVVGQLLAGDVANSTPTIVIPISSEIRAAFSKVDIGIPSKPTIRPAKIVTEKMAGGERHAAFTVTSKGDVKIIRQRRKGKKK